MSPPEFVEITDELAETVALYRGAAPPENEPEPLVQIETWAQFAASATADIPTIVDKIWPTGGLGFIAAPPKKGKTWIGLDLAISVATATPFLGHFDVPAAAPVIYLALEGHRAAIRGRIGCLTRGHDRDPDTTDLEQLRIIYKPRGINLADPQWVDAVTQAVRDTATRMLVVDVMRAAAAVKENSNDDVRDLLRALAPLQELDCSVAMLHHFGKLTELTKDRSPGERMAGAGAMYGAFDVGVFITGSDDGAKKLRIEFELRDLATPEPLGVHLQGNATGINGGFIYHDRAHWQQTEAPAPAEPKVPADEIAEYVLANGGDVERREVEGYFEISPGTLSARLYHLQRDHGIELVVGRGRGTRSRLVATRLEPEDPQLSLAPESDQRKPSVESRHWQLNGTDDFIPLNQAESGVSYQSDQSRQSGDWSQTESTDLQGDFSDQSCASPTERQPSAEATEPPRNGDPDLDELADTVDLEQPLGFLDD